jgi:hypothetical protein
VSGTMKKLVTVEQIEGEGLDALLGENVLLMCGNYFYSGKLVGITADCVKLEDPAIVYETGKWSDTGYTDRQALHTDVWYVMRAAIESFGLSK